MGSEVNTHTHTHTVAVFVTVEDIRTTVLLPDKWSCADVQVFQEHEQTLRRWSDCTFVTNLKK